MQNETRKKARILWHNWRRTMLGCAFALLAGLAGCGKVQAQLAPDCTLSSSGTTALQPATTLTIAQGEQTEISTGFHCSGSRFSIAMTQTITATISGRLSLTNASGDSLPFSLCSSSSCSTIYGDGKTISWTYTDWLSILGLFNASDGSLPLYVTIPAGNYDVSAGNYTGSFSINWSWNLCGGLGLGSICILPIRGSKAQAISLSLALSADCTINAPDINFGAAPLINGFTPVHGALQISCSKGSAYTVGLSNGNHYDGTSRQMASGSNKLRYEIYQQSGGHRWGATGSQRRASSSADQNAGSLNGETPQVFDYTARILLNQPTPPPGTYADSIIVDVKF